MNLKEAIPPGMEPVIILAVVIAFAVALFCVDRLVKLYCVMLHRRQQEHDRRAEEKRQNVIGLYGVDE